MVHDGQPVKIVVVMALWWWHMMHQTSHTKQQNSKPRPLTTYGFSQQIVITADDDGSSQVPTMVVRFVWFRRVQVWTIAAEVLRCVPLLQT